MSDVKKSPTKTMHKSEASFKGSKLKILSNDSCSTRINLYSSTSKIAMSIFLEVENDSNDLALNRDTKLMKTDATMKKVPVCPENTVHVATFTMNQSDTNPAQRKRILNFELIIFSSVLLYPKYTYFELF